jgi:ABC-type molybdate transport system substrate-binding protein
VAHHATIVFEVPVAAGPRIVYPAAVLKTAPDAADARGFLAFLRGSAAAAVFDRFGFVVNR